MISGTHPDFERLVPAGADYATRPIDDAFDWTAIARSTDAGEWYLVVFRSIRKQDADEARLTWFDDRAHAEAAQSPGFVHYFKGPLTADGACLSFCLWASRADARAAAGKPLHREAATLIAESYERYTLEFFRVTKAVGADTLRIEPYDRRA